MKWFSKGFKVTNTIKFKSFNGVEIRQPGAHDLKRKESKPLRLQEKYYFFQKKSEQRKLGCTQIMKIYFMFKRQLDVQKKQKKDKTISLLLLVTQYDDGLTFYFLEHLKLVKF